MGVPVLTIPGARFCGRHAAVHLTHGGYPEGVATSIDDLVAKAKRLADNPTALGDLRMTLRDRFLKSTVCDVERFAAAFYGTLRNEWSCAQASAAVNKPAQNPLTNFLSLPDLFGQSTIHVHEPRSLRVTRTRKSLGG